MAELENAYVVGERVWLRALTEDDLDSDWYTWFSDEEVTKYTGHWRPNTADRQREFFESRVKKSGDLVLGIVEKQNGKLIGVVSLSKINWVHRYADIALIVGDAEARKKASLGFEAFALMIRVGFLRMNLENIKGGFMTGQTASREILKVLKFEEVGRFKDLYIVDGEPMDQILVQLNRNDWIARNAVSGRAGKKG